MIVHTADTRNVRYPAACLGVLLVFLAVTFGPASCVSPVFAEDAPGPSQSAAERGFRWLTEKAYLPADFDDEVFDQLWKCWPEPLRSEAELADAETRRTMAFARYGLSPRPRTSDGHASQSPLQYVVSDNGQWSMNCFACHGGLIEGQAVPGLPNSNYALETLIEDVRKTKLELKKPLGHMDVGSLFMPLGKSRGTTNAVMFGVALLAYRDDDLNLLGHRLPPRMIHHDMDAPPWWHFSEKSKLYIDGFAPKGHRALMQFMLVEQNGPEDFKNWENDFRDVYAFLSSLKPPKYPRRIDSDLAKTGQVVFSNHCAECHGNDRSDYPEITVSWDVIRTDPVRLKSLTPDHRRKYATSWFNRGRSNAAGAVTVELDPRGYVAPPLSGVWASAPYLHNGSVPTLWHLLNPDQRPKVWRRKSTSYDHQRMGLDVVEFTELPTGMTSASVRREFFNSGAYGKSAAGHDFPNQLSEEEKVAVLEYLKTL